MKYTKHALSFEQQIALLRERGLAISDPDGGARLLAQVSYYRLSAYMKPFMKEDKFAEGTTLVDVEALYMFDKRLRSILSEPLELIEVYFRTQITYVMAMRGGKFAHTRPEMFVDSCNHAELLKRCADDEFYSKSQFVKHYRYKYNEEQHLPIWMVTELMSFGSVSRWYPLLRTDIQQQIAMPFAIDRSVLATWLECLSYVRNICAHHARLWNKELSIRPAIPRSRDRWSYVTRDNKRCYVVLLVLMDLLSRTHPDNPWRDALASFLESCTSLQLSGMDTPKTWKQIGPWKRDQ